jgi:O-antigen ligase
MPNSFLQNKIYFILTLSVIATTVFSWFNLNSYCIILLLLCRLLEGGPGKAIRTAFSNRYFLAYFAYFLIAAAGLLYTHNSSAGGHIVEKDATLLAIPFIICAGPFADEHSFRRLMNAYCLILLAACLYCLAVAALHYRDEKNISVFFYHPFSHAIHENAIYFSLFMIFGLLYLLSPGCRIETTRLSAKTGKYLRLFFIWFFIGIIILLASKLLLLFLFLILIHFILRRYPIGENKKLMGLMGLGILLVLGTVALTRNPIKERYLDIYYGDLNLIRQKKFGQATYFNGVQLRLLEWQFALQILEEKRAWLIGVSPGDSQDLLNEKYIEADMYIGDPSRNSSGFLTYNFHNQYIENFVQSGVIGLAVFLYLCGLLISVVWKWRTREAFFTVVILLTLFVTESFITLQHGVFLFSFFPLLLLYSPKKAPEEAKR